MRKTLMACIAVTAASTCLGQAIVVRDFTGSAVLPNGAAVTSGQLVAQPYGTMPGTAATGLLSGSSYTYTIASGVLTCTGGCTIVAPANYVFQLKVYSGSVLKQTLTWRAGVAASTSPVTMEELYRNATSEVEITPETVEEGDPLTVLSSGTATAGHVATADGSGGITWSAGATGDITGVTAGAGLTGGGESGSVTLAVGAGTGITVSDDAVSLSNTSVTPGTYGSSVAIPSITVDSQGRITGASETGITLAHDMLSATHTDSTAAAVQRGDIIAAQGSPARWERLAKGSSGSVLVSGADEPAWGTVGATGLTDGAALAEILDDDGTGSGLDADMLDGLESTAFAAATHDHDAAYVNVTGDTMTGDLIATGITGADALLGIAGKAGASGGNGGDVAATGGAGDINGSGGNASLVGGAGAGTGAGGTVSVIGGASAGATGTAGGVSVDAGAANGGTAAGVTVGATNASTVTIGTTARASSTTVNALLNAATGDEAALTLNYTTNKATSGGDLGLKIANTVSSSPGASYPLWIGVSATPWYRFGIGNAATTGAFDASSGNEYGVTLAPNFSGQTGTAGHAALRIDMTPGSGSGASYLISAGTSGNTKFAINAMGTAFVLGGSYTRSMKLYRNTFADGNILSGGSDADNPSVVISSYYGSDGKGTYIGFARNSGYVVWSKNDNAENDLDVGIARYGDNTLKVTSGLTLTGLGGLVVGKDSTATSGTAYGLRIIPTYNQASGTASNTELRIDRTQTAVGSGQQYSIWAGVGGTAWYTFGVGNTATTGAFNASSGTEYGVMLAPNFSGQTGTAGYTGLLVNVTDGGGSGPELLADFQSGGSSKFSISASGSITAPGNATVLGTLDLGADDDTSTLTIHDAGTIVMYDDSDDTSVTIGPVADGTTTLGVTGGLAVSGAASVAGDVTLGDASTDTVTFSGTPMSTNDVGTPGTGCSAAEYGDGIWHKTVLTCDISGANKITIPDGTKHGSALIYTWPERFIAVLIVKIDGTLTNTTNFNADPNDYISAGVGTIEADDIAPISGSESDLIQVTTYKTFGGSVTSRYQRKVSLGGITIDAQAQNMWLNYLIPDANNTDSNDLTFSGTVTFFWVNAGGY